MDIKNKTSFDFIRYASVWEDADTLCEALAPSCQGGRILSVASAGDNVLALLTIDPEEIVAADLNLSQLACLELRMSAFRRLDYAALLSFLGVVPSSIREKIYQDLKQDLSPSAKAYWDQHPNEIQNGIIHAGKFERYLRTFGRWVLPIVHSKRIREELLDKRTLFEQEGFYETKWDTFLWRQLFRLFFSRRLMGFFGRDPAFFDYVAGNVSKHILSRTKHALTKIPTFSNPYLTYIITGNYSMKALPRYLRAEFKESIASKLDRISMSHGPIHNTNRGPFDGFNLSDIFEYMDENEFLNCYLSLIDQANPKARLAYWNMLVPRKLPAALKDRAKELKDDAEILHLREKAWFYMAFRIDEVQKR